jgi:hypothetical protein
MLGGLHMDLPARQLRRNIAGGGVDFRLGILVDLFRKPCYSGLGFYCLLDTKVTKTASLRLGAYH